MSLKRRNCPLTLGLLTVQPPPTHTQTHTQSFPQAHFGVYLRLEEREQQKQPLGRPLGDWFATQSKEAAPWMRALASCREHQPLEKEKTLFSPFLPVQMTLSLPLFPWRNPLLSPVSPTLTGGGRARHWWFQSTLCLHAGSGADYCVNWLMKEVQRQIKLHRRPQIRWFIELEAEELERVLSRSDLFTCPSVLIWWNRFTQWRYGKVQTNVQSDCEWGLCRSRPFENFPPQT